MGRQSDVKYKMSEWQPCIWPDKLTFFFVSDSIDVVGNYSCETKNPQFFGGVAVIKVHTYVIFCEAWNADSGKSVFRVQKSWV